MTIHRKPRKSPIDTFSFMLDRDRIGDAFDRVGAYFTESLGLSFATPEGVSGVLNELIRQHGEPVRSALADLMCAPGSTLRPMLENAKAGSPDAMIAELVPVLSRRYALAPGAALLVATLVLKALAANGEQALCEELTRQHRKAARKQRSGEARTQGKITAARRDREVTRARRAVLKRRSPSKPKRP